VLEAVGLRAAAIGTRGSRKVVDEHDPKDPGTIPWQTAE
jgi:hypothetical protein